MDNLASCILWCYNSLPKLTKEYMCAEQRADGSYKSSYEILRRLLNGADGEVTSLQSKGLVIRDKKQYMLSPFGVLFAISFFGILERLSIAYDDTRCYYKPDMSYQSKSFTFRMLDSGYNSNTKRPDGSDITPYQMRLGGILGSIRKHYDYFPLFFEYLDYLREHRDIDVDLFTDILSGDQDISVGYAMINFMHYDRESFNDSLNDMIPLLFYIKTLENRKYLQLPNALFESVSTIMYPLLRSLGDLTFSGWKLLAKIDTVKPRSKIVSDFLEELYRGSSNLENGKKLRSLFSHKK